MHNDQQSTPLSGRLRSFRMSDFYLTRFAATVVGIRLTHRAESRARLGAKVLIYGRALYLFRSLDWFLSGNVLFLMASSIANQIRATCVSHHLGK